MYNFILSVLYYIGVYCLCTYFAVPLIILSFRKKELTKNDFMWVLISPISFVIIVLGIIAGFVQEVTKNYDD